MSGKPQSDRQSKSPRSTASDRRLVTSVILACFAVAALSLLILQRPAPPQPAPAVPRQWVTTPLPPPPPPSPPPGLAEVRRRWKQRQAMRARLEDARSLRRFTRECIASGDPLTAYLTLKEYLRTHPAEPPVLDALGRVQLHLGLATGAERTYRQIIGEDPQGAQGYIGLSRALVMQERWQEATHLLESAWNAVPTASIRERLALVQEWEQRGDLPRALQAVQELDRAAPDTPDVTMTLARILFKLQRLAEARQELETLIRAQPDNAPAHALLGSILMNPLLAERDFARAEESLLIAVQAHPDDMTSLSRLGQLYMEQGRMPQAANVYTRMLQRAPNLPDARMQLAKAYALMGNPAGSREQTLLARRPLANRLEEERLTIRRDQRPSDANARLTLARYYLQIGDTMKAMAEVQAAALLQPQSEQARREFRTLYARLGITPPDLPDP
ncbi:MAG: tetratricopeptide repeat protein [Chthonomonadaceae bacterium]|nr:tetratricopeptide repeat protein [Chthonomonadaceae bacterium]